ncbi:MAG: hypothetical protein K2O18_00740 [Oscillospiraceae bacterium]|nr:hypothetical protein [Oscillospiraceae bacterium]
MSYKDLYFQLFAAITDALAALESGKTIRAIQILLRASESGESAHMEADILPDLPLE